MASLSSGSQPRLGRRGFLLRRKTDYSRPPSMKRSASPSDLINRTTPWLDWWQELLLNWAASWNNVGCLTVSAPDDPNQWVAWSLPSDLELKRLELEELLAGNDP